MPNNVLTNLAKAQAKLQGSFQAGELRFREPVVFKSLTANAAIMLPDYTSLRVREDRPVEAGYALRTSRGLSNARSHNHTGAKGDTGVLTPSWIPQVDVFFTNLKNGNNTYNSAEQLEKELVNVYANMAEGIESDAADFLFNNRSTANIATAEGAFDGVNNFFAITDATNGNRAMQIIKSMMHENKYTGAVTVYCDTVLFNKFGFQAAQGSGNQENLTFQFGGVNFVHSVEMNALAAGLGITKGFCVAMQAGMAAALPWIPIQNRNGHSDTEGDYTSIINPVDGLSYAVHMYKERFNGTPVNGQTQDVKTEFEVSLDIAYDYAPLTDGSTPLLAVALV